MGGEPVRRASCRFAGGGHAGRVTSGRRGSTQLLVFPRGYEHRDRHCTLLLAAIVLDAARNSAGAGHDYGVLAVWRFTLWAG